ncbi:MAG: hypothetical protein HY245_08760 [Rhizobiales bacterium]|nr:hypothetical protein [Hyphomicrobiales bacterium]
MNIRSTLYGGTAAAVLLVSSVALLPASWNPLPAAHASVDVAIGFGTFYDRLADYGDWVSFRGQYVWVPVNIGPHWRPYVIGHWVWTRRYGWLWVSNEPFGWATYHYGRWGFSYDIGWYWVPGSIWAPAWVSWRRSDNDIIWAPLPPGRDDFDVGVSIDAIPEYYWNCVSARQFLEPNLSLIIVFDANERRRILRRAPAAGHVIIENNIVVNNGINVNYVEQRTGKKVKVVEVDNSDKPGSAVQSGDRLTVFTGKIAPDGERKPPGLTDFATVKTIHEKHPGRITRNSGEPEMIGPVLGAGQATRAKPGSDNAQGNNVTVSKDKNSKRNIRDTGGQLPQVVTGTGNVGKGQSNADLLRNKKFKRLRELQMQQDQTGGDFSVQQVRRKHKLQQQNGLGGESFDGNGPVVPGHRNKKFQERQLQQMNQSSQGQGDQQPVRRKRLKCDPNTDANC